MDCKICSPGLNEGADVLGSEGEAGVMLTVCGSILIKGK